MSAALAITVSILWATVVPDGQPPALLPHEAIFAFLVSLVMGILLIYSSYRCELDDSDEKEKK